MELVQMLAKFGLTRRIFSLTVASMLLAAQFTAAQAQKTDTTTLTIFAAASLKNALDNAATAYKAKTGEKIVISYAGSSALAKQIKEGAPADIFISADLAWMDYLAKAGAIKEDTRSNMLGNKLVLIAPKSSTVSIKIGPDFPLAKTLGDGRLAVADVKAVPAGKYATAALKKLGVWEAVEPKLAQAENVRAALALVAQGEAPLGIVYQTDAAAEPKVKIIDAFPDDTHPPIIYPIAVTASTANAKAALAFIDYLKSPAGQAAFTEQGFTVLK
jgi:molybdate transport system substrate-binding protein